MKPARADHRNPYTFAASVRFVAGDGTACLRLIFEDASGRALAIFRSMPVANRDFAAVAISGYPPPGMARIAVDFATESPSETNTLVVRDAVLVEHPVYVAK